MSEMFKEKKKKTKNTLSFDLSFCENVNYLCTCIPYNIVHNIRVWIIMFILCTTGMYNAP